MTGSLRPYDWIAAISIAHWKKEAFLSLLQDIVICLKKMQASSTYISLTVPTYFSFNINILGTHKKNIGTFNSD